MWGTTPSSAKLTGDSGSGFEAALIGDCRLFRLSAENWSPGILGVLQHYQGKTGSERRAVKAALFDPNVWSGRALQEVSSTWQMRSCINVSGL
jgi:hypothetical protein